jgi:hypothetical protein
VKIATRMLAIASFAFLFVTLTPAAQAQTLPLLNQTVSGTLVGNSGGAFNKYILQYPGDGRPVTIQMTYSPSHPNSAYGIGFQVWGPNAQLLGEGAPVEGQPTVLSLTLTSDTPGDYVVSVQNYYPGFQMSYTLQAEGLQQPPAAPNAGLTASAPIPLAGASQGVLAGNQAGSFNYYDLHTDGNESIWISMTYQPNLSIIAPAVGFNVYQGSHLVAKGIILDQDPSTRVVSLVAQNPADYVVQVYNYAPSVELNYQLQITRTPLNP